MADSDITIVGLQATGGVSQIVLAWAVDDPNLERLPYLRFDHADVYMSELPDMSGEVKVGSASTAIVDLPVERGATRYYQALAVDRSAREGARSAIVSAKEISGDVLLAVPGHWSMPNGFLEMWGTAATAGGLGLASVTISKDFSFNIFNVELTASAGSVDEDDKTAGYTNVWSPVLDNITFGGGIMSMTISLRRARAHHLTPTTVTVEVAPDNIDILWRVIGQKL